MYKCTEINRIQLGNELDTAEMDDDAVEMDGDDDEKLQEGTQKDVHVTHLHVINTISRHG